MSEPPPETYILPVPGTDQTEEVTRGTVLARMARGEITANHWVWSPPDQDWKQVSEIPSLRAALPASALQLGPAAAPAARKSLFGSGGEKKKAPRPPAPAPVRRKVVRPARQKKREGDFSLLGFLAGLLVLTIPVLVILNYEFIDQPFDGNLAQTPFVLVQAHAHLGAFVQSDTLVIHVLPRLEFQKDNLPNVVRVLPNPELTPANFADLLSTLARSTPPPPFGWKPFRVVEITPSWRGEYAFSGDDWRQLAQMDQSSPDDRKNFILDHVDDQDGHRLVPAADSDTAKAERDRVWQEMLGNFLVSGN